MNIQTLFRRTPMTALLVTSFVVLFIIQIVSGVNINNPSGEALILWGANALPYTMDDEPWRLLSSAFLHIGLMHLLFNGFAMYLFGQAAEITFGSIKFLLLFLLSAIGGNLLNSYVTWWGIVNDNGGVNLAAGASGGIMGIGMALLILELLKHTVLKMPKTGDRSQLKSLALIMAINLMYGFAIDGIDNAGHIGGAITGGVIALSIIFGYRFAALGKSAFLKALPWLSFVIIGIIFVWLWYNLHQQIMMYVTTY